MQHTNIPVSIRAKFDAGHMPEPNSGCWLWLGPVVTGGYGTIYGHGRPWIATRVSLAIDGRPVSDGQIACHRCDNPSCVNPAHLFVGTHSDNARDAVSKGRWPRGRAHLRPDIFGAAE